MTVTTIPVVGIQSLLEVAPSLDLTGWTVIAGKMIPRPDQQISVRHTGGKPGEVAVAVDYPSIQLMSRGNSGGYASAYAILKHCREALVAIPNGGVSFPEMISCTPIGDIQDLGYDDNNRPMFSQNLQLILEYEVSGYRIL